MTNLLALLMSYIPLAFEEKVMNNSTKYFGAKCWPTPTNAAWWDLDYLQHSKGKVCSKFQSKLLKNQVQACNVVMSQNNI